jgi:DNA repair protein RadC
MFSLLHRRLQEEAGRELNALLRRLVSRSVDGGALDLVAGNDETVRFLVRVGLLPAGRLSESARAERVADVLGRMSRESGRPDLEVAACLRIHAAGEAGLGIEAFCGDMPRCRACALAGCCRQRQLDLAAPPPARSERPSRRLRAEGEEALTGAELLALVLSGPGLGEDEALRLARRLVGDTGSLRDLAARPLAELEALDGMNPGLAARLRSALGLARRWDMERRAEGRQFRSGRDFLEFYAPRLRDAGKESFFVVLLDQKNRFMGEEPVSVGTLTGAPVHPREVFRPAIRAGAAAVAFVHNHPSGSPEPSRDDREITARLLEVARLVGLRVLDHVIVGEDAYYSFAESGLL